MLASESLLNVELPLKLRFASRTMLLRDVAALEDGGAIEFSRAADNPVEVIVEGRVVALGEVAVSRNNYCVRITQMAGQE